MHRLPDCTDEPLPIRLVVAEKDGGRRSMSGPYDPEYSEQTQQSAWGGAHEHQTGGQQFAGGGGTPTSDGQMSGYAQYGTPGTYGAYGGSGQPLSGGYGEQQGGSGAGWGYAPSYAPPPGQRSTSRPLTGAPEQAPQDAQGWAGGYAGGYYGPPSQALQPFQPPQPPQPPYGSYGSYGPASGNWGAYGGGAYGGEYGQYGPPSQYGGYGQYGQPSQWGQPIAIEAPARPPWSMRRKLVVFGGLVALLVALVGGGLGYVQYNAPTAAANRICTDFHSQHYVDMYGMFDTQLQARMTPVQFAQAVLDIDRAEGQTTKCEALIQANGFTDSSATATLVLSRPNADGLQGIAHLSNQGGAWKVTALDQSLFGVDLRTLNSVDNYCSALIGQTYDAAYGMLDKAQQGKQKQTDYRQDAAWRDEIDGNVTACHVAAIGANDDTTANLTLSVTRSKSGEHQGTLAVTLEGTGWKIHSVADEALGTDIGPIRTGTRFCNDLASANYNDIVNLFSGGATLSVNEAASIFSGGYDGIKWDKCTSDLSTFKLSGSSASYVASFTVTRLADGRSITLPGKIEFTKAGHTWTISNFDFKNPNS